MQTIYRYPSREVLRAFPKLPFFYIIRHISSGLFYAGYRGKKPDLATFMLKGGYCTSSQSVKRLIDVDGTQSFIVCRVILFMNMKEARRYESRFLKKVNARMNPFFLNKTNGDENFCQKSGWCHSMESRMKISQKAQGRKVSDETKTKIGNSVKGLLVGPKNPMYGKIGELNPFYGKTHTKQTKAIIAEKAKSHIGWKQTEFQKSVASKRIGGSIYVHHPNDTQMKRIRPEDLEEYLLTGWIRGMGKSFKHTLK